MSRQTAEKPRGPTASELLAWYQQRARVLPWRQPPGDRRRPDPYRIWLSEVMLQQTTVPAVIQYFERFVGRWPNVEALAAADIDDVMTEWAGLGYYARARNLYKCAGIVAADHSGRFPETEADLLQLPGIGPYTAAAIAAIAFDQPAVVVDGNVERVMARLFAVVEPLPGSKGQLRRLATSLTETLAPGSSPGDYAQAAMDLGATVCTPTSPRCGACPWRGNCQATVAGIADTLPRRQAKSERPTRRGNVFWLMRSDGAVLLRRRPPSGLLGGMMEVPTGQWREGRRPAADREAPENLNWHRLPGSVSHTFTHFHLELTVHAAVLPDKLPGRTSGLSEMNVDNKWVQPADFGGHALPSLMQKVARHALAHLADK